MERKNVNRHSIAGAVGFGLVLVVLLAGGGLGYVSAGRLARDNERVARTHAVAAACESLMAAVSDAEAGGWGFVLTQDEKDLGPYDAAAKRVGAGLARLDQLAAEDPDQRTRLAALDQKVAERLNVLNQAVALAKTGDRAAARRAPAPAKP